MTPHNTPAGRSGLDRLLNGVANGLPWLKPAAKGGLRLRGRLVRPIVVGRYFRTHAVRRLDLGSGGRALDGWLPADVLPTRWGTAYVNAERRFPFRDAVFQHVYAEHLIEHLSYAGARRMLSESLRVLEPGGRIRVVTPDLTRLMSLFDADRSPAQRAYLEWYRIHVGPDVPEFSAVHAMNAVFHGWKHRFIFDPQTLATLLSDAGFEDVTPQPYGHSAEPALRGLESHGARVSSPAIDAYEVMILEGRRAK